MATPTLFNLDPTQFALGRSTGRLQQLVGAPTQQSVIELGKMLQGISPVSLEKPGEFTMEAPVFADPKTTYKNYLNVGNVDKTVNSIASMSDDWVRGYLNSDRALELVLSGQTSDPLNTAYTKNVAIRSMQEISRAYNEAIKAEAAKADPYNAAVAEYKKRAEAYNTEVNRYNTELETTRNKFQSEYLNQDVNQDPTLSEGEVLAASNLYSDTLHQQMLERIADANTDPASDSLTSLYSR